MRRPLLVIFIIVLLISIITTNIENSKLHSDTNNKEVKIEGIVKNKIEKPRYIDYEVNEFLIRDYSKNKNLNVGSKVEVIGELQEIEKREDEDFDYEKYLKSVGYKGLVYISEYKIIEKESIYTYINNMKVKCINTFRYLYKDNSDFMNSILFAQREDLSQNEEEMFKRSGTSHIVSISGMHISIICAIVAFIIKGINKPYKLIILYIFTSIYCIMIGAQTSVIRALGSSLIFHISIFIDKRKDGISTLSFLAIIMIINNPYIIYNISFQLSFLATLSIIYFYGYINDKLKVSIISITIAANILTIPIIYYNFKGISIISLLSNIIVVPFIGLVLILGILSLTLFCVNIGLSQFVANMNILIIDSIYFILEKLNGWYLSYVEVEEVNIYYVAIYYMVVFSYMTYKEIKIMKEQENDIQGYCKGYQRTKS